MAVETITTPVGIDVPIKKLQSLFQASLWTSYTYEAQPRVAILNGEPHLFRKASTVNNYEYEKMVLNDKLSAHSYFVSNESELVAYNSWSAQVDIVFYVNLKTCYPSVLNRADENAMQDIYNLLESEPYGFRINNIYRDQSALEGLKQSDTMQPYCCIRVSGEIDYQYVNTSCND